MRIFLKFFLALAIFFSPNFALANNLYFSAQGGATFLSDADQTSDSTVFSTATDFDTGYNVGGAVGLKMNDFRFEVEVAYREVGADTLEVTNDAGLGVAVGLGSLVGLTVKLDGDVQTLSYMANAYYDFNNKSSFTPFVGFGIGGATIDLSELKTSGVTLVDDDDTVFAYKIGGGVAFKATSNLDLTIDYHYLGTTDPEFTDAAGGKFETEYESHNVNFGIRYYF